VAPLTVVPGLSVEVNVGGGDDTVFLISTDGGIRNTSAAAAWVTGRVALFVDGVMVPNTGERLVTAANNLVSAGPPPIVMGNAIGNWSFGLSLTLPPGLHTIDVRAVATCGSPGVSAEVSSGDTTLRQGQLTVAALKR
jgi:hypothetical protein